MTTTARFSGAKIRQARHDKGWTQAELARRAGIRERQVIRWENEQHSPRLDGIAKIAAVTGLAVGDFIADDDTETLASEDEEEDAMVALMRGLRALVREATREGATA